ncbi:hypothetical protein L5515_007330 [Caenorhabditis briggsae]|nr:hypothetical protein L5515_007330 [Caenorhabditis briggsae]
METTTEKPKAITEKPKGGFMRNLILSENCEKWIRNTIPVLIPALLIDQSVLVELQENMCDNMSYNKPIKIAVDSNQSLKLNTEKFEIVQFKNTTEKDYLEFNSSSNSKLIIPK